MFISVGPSGFTISAIVNMGQTLPKVVPEDFMGAGMGKIVGQVSMIMANWMGLWLWGLALWFFFISVGAHYSCARRGKMDFSMVRISFLFRIRDDIAAFQNIESQSRHGTPSSSLTQP